MLSDKPYSPQSFNLHGLQGISDKTVDMHLALYEGYVKAANSLQKQIAGFLKDGTVDQEEMPAYSELTRRLGFEYNGMVLHEYYFANMKKRKHSRDGKENAFRRKRSITALHSELLPAKSDSTRGVTNRPTPRAATSTFRTGILSPPVLIPAARVPGVSTIS